MPPNRTRRSKPAKESSQASYSVDLEQPDFKTRTKPHTVGLQKLKSGLRQTKRLLAKNNLAADVRVETERRLKGLESEINQQQLANKERSIAIRYRKVKFFERQKVVRKIHQLSKRLTTSGPNPDLEDALFEARVDLNYIMRYPSATKYISLFPPEVRHGGATGASLSSQLEPSKTDRARQEMRDRIRQLMRNGRIPLNPEDPLQPALKHSDVDLDETKRFSTRRLAGDIATKTGGVLESDEFFESNDPHEEGNDSSSDSE